MATVTLLLALFVALIVVLAIAIESGRAAERIRLVVGAVVVSLMSAVTLVVSADEASAVRKSVEKMVQQGGWLFGAQQLAGTAGRTPGLDGVVFLTDCETCPKLVSLRGGTYEMGLAEYLERAPAEGPIRQITVSSFALGRTEVTRSEFAQFITATGYQAAAGCELRTGFNASATWQAPGFAQSELHPVVCISHADALAYIEWLNGQTGKGYRLPSEAEWEYAARLGGDAQIMNQSEKGGHTTPNVANPRGMTLPVGLLPANRIGLVDMTGNAAEWVADCWTPDLSLLPVDGRAMGTPDGETCRTGVRRGSSWRTPIGDVRPSRRDVGGPSSTTGFRLARDLSFVERSGLASIGPAHIAEMPGQTASR